MHAERDVFGLKMVLLLGHNGGCDGDYSEPQLRRGWRVFRDELMERPGCRAGTRPWAFWTIEHGMDSDPAYADGVVLLAERGELSAGEVAEIERFGMDGRERLAAGGYLHENAVRADVELAERMREALNLVAGASHNDKARFRRS